MPMACPLLPQDRDYDITCSRRRALGGIICCGAVLLLCHIVQTDFGKVLHDFPRLHAHIADAGKSEAISLANILHSSTVQGQPQLGFRPWHRPIDKLGQHRHNVNKANMLFFYHGKSQDAALLRSLDAGQDSDIQPMEEVFSETHGPLALLLIGYTEEEVEKFRTMLIEDLDAGMVPLIIGRESMMKGTLRQALDSESDEFEQIPGRLKTLILSGMYAGEMSEVIQAYKEKGLPDAAFSAAVPNNLNRNLKDLVDELETQFVAEMVTKPS